MKVHLLGERIDLNEQVQRFFVLFRCFAQSALSLINATELMVIALFQ